jgi:thioredoxin-like negative regulator of GroEL
MGARSGHFRKIVLVAMAASLLWIAWHSWKTRHFRQAIAQVEAQMENGLYALAARQLAVILADNPESDEANFLLGRCELARLRPEAARSAWARVPPDSRFAPQAILGNMQIAMEQGRLGEAERIISDALADPRVDGSSLPILLGPIYCQQGRVQETLRLLELRWGVLNKSGEGASDAAMNLVRAHIELRQTPIPIDAVAAGLEYAGRLAPDDDRMMLGKANLALRTSATGEAGRLLEVCRRLRPDDPPVWRARLDWAVATHRVADVRECLKLLPADETTPAQIDKLTAWLARELRDSALERHALERAIASDPTDFLSLERLQELLVQAGQPDRAAALDEKKADVKRSLARYQILYKRNQPRRDAAEMARLAGQLGQPFESRGYLTRAAAVNPDLRDELKALVDHQQVSGPPGRTLADVIGPELAARDEKPAHPTSVPGDRHARSN